MKIETTSLPGVLLVTPRAFADTRGYFLETFQAARYVEAGMPGVFVQDNLSRSAKGTLRGIHYQVGAPQGKLVTVVRGAAYDVAIDLRRSSATFGRWYGTVLTDENHAQLWVPEGFGHGFLAMSDICDFAYKVTAPYAPAAERCLRWDAAGIDWPLEGVGAPLLSPKDAAAPGLDAAEVFA